MSKNDNNMLALLKIMHRESDENNPISMSKIISLMAESGHEISDDTIARYFKKFESELGLKVVSTKGRTASYYISKRLLEKSEAKLIIDAVNASNFIEKDIAKDINIKIKSILSRRDADDLARSVFIVSNTKSENNKILDNVDKLQIAINKKVQIKFDYVAWDKNKKLVKKEKRYTFNPWALIWAYDRYYLLGYDTDEEHKRRLYRVDKLENIEVTDIIINESHPFRDFNANSFVSERIWMFDKANGEVGVIKVRTPQRLVGVFIDQFGKNRINVEEDEDKLIVSFRAMVTSNLLGWLIGLGEVEILGPDSLKEEIKSLLEANINFYK